MVDLGQKKVELSTFFYAVIFPKKKAARNFLAAGTQLINLCEGFAICVVHIV